MKRNLVTVLICLLFSMFVYSYCKFRQVGKWYYNTEFSSRDVPIKFYQINIGDTKESVEAKIGNELYKDSSWYYYSKRGNEFFFGNICTYFLIEYREDTVYIKRVVEDD